MNCRKCKNAVPDGAIFCCWCGEKLIRERKKKDDIKIPSPRQMPSGKWIITLRAEGVSKSFDTEQEARIWAQAVRADFIAAKKAAPKMPLSKAIDIYIDSKRGKVSPSTITSYLKIKRTRFIILQNTDISDLNLSVMQDAIDKEIAQGISAKTLKDAVCFVRTVLRYNDINPTWWCKLSLPKVKKKVYTLITPEQIPIFIKAIKGNPCELQLLLALWLGLRRSEILALRKEDFNINTNEVTIKAALVRDEYGNWVDSGTKEEASVRVIICPPYIMDMVKAMPDGKLYQYEANYILKCLHRVCDDCGLPPIRLHDLRHVSASINDLLNMPDNYSMEMHGWSNTHTMKTVYEQSFDSERERWAKIRYDYFEQLISKA